VRVAHAVLGTAVGVVWLVLPGVTISTEPPAPAVGPGPVPVAAAQEQDETSTTGLVLPLLAVAAVGAVAGYGYVRHVRRSRTRARTTHPAAGAPVAGPLAAPPAELDARSLALLAEADDCVRTSREELGFAEARFGTAAVTPYARAVRDAEAELSAAFRMRQQYDEGVPADRSARQHALAGIVGRCQEAGRRLDTEAAGFDGLRGLEEGIGEALELAEARFRALTGRTGATDATLADLGRRYGSGATADVTGHAEQAKDRLVFATFRLNQTRQATDLGEPENAARHLRAAEGAITQAAAFVDDIDHLATSLTTAAALVPAALTGAETEIAGARKELALASMEAGQGETGGGWVTAEAGQGTAGAGGVAAGGRQGATEAGWAPRAAGQGTAEAGRTSTESGWGQSESGQGPPEADRTSAEADQTPKETEERPTEAGRTTTEADHAPDSAEQATTAAAPAFTEADQTPPESGPAPTGASPATEETGHAAEAGTAEAGRASAEAGPASREAGQEPPPAGDRTSAAVVRADRTSAGAEAGQEPPDAGQAADEARATAAADESPHDAPPAPSAPGNAPPTTPDSAPPPTPDSAPATTPGNPPPASPPDAPPRSPSALSPAALPAGELRARILHADVALAAVREELTAGPYDPLRALRRILGTVSPLGVGRAGVMGAVASLAARSAVALADGFVGTHRGAVGGAARTRLAEAERLLRSGTYAADLRADALARQARELAEQDVRVHGNPVAGAAEHASGLGGAVLGGVLLGGAPAGGPSASFGGPGTRARRGPAPA
jgi:hypothetical protein